MTGGLLGTKEEKEGTLIWDSVEDATISVTVGGTVRRIECPLSFRFKTLFRKGLWNGGRVFYLEESRLPSSSSHR